MEGAANHEVLFYIFNYYIKIFIIYLCNHIIYVLLPVVAKLTKM